MTIRNRKRKIFLAGENFVVSDGFGTVCLNTEKYRHNLLNVLYVKDLQAIFISVSKALKRGFKMSFQNNYAYFKDENDSIIMKAK